MTPVVVKCGIEEEFPLFLTGAAYGAALAILIIAVPLMLYVLSLRKERKAAWNTESKGEK